MGIIRNVLGGLYRQCYCSREAIKEADNIKYVIQSRGFDTGVEQCANKVMQRFSSNPEQRKMEIIQFLREEADAASRGDANAQRFASAIFSDLAAYKGAMKESAAYPIDQSGGPQDMLLAHVLALRDEPEIMVKFRCLVVTKVASRL